MTHSQQKALANHRRRLGERGLARYEVRGLEQDKGLVRELAKQLAKNDTTAERLRQQLVKQVGTSSPVRGGFLQWIRSSPLAGLDLDTDREWMPGRDVNL